MAQQTMDAQMGGENAGTEELLLLGLWTKSKNRLPIMQLRSGAEDIARKVDQRDIDAALPKLVAWAETSAYHKD